MFKSAEFEYKNSVTINNQPREFISKMIITSAIMKDDVTILRYSKPSLKKVSDATFNLKPVDALVLLMRKKKTTAMICMIAILLMAIFCCRHVSPMLWKFLRKNIRGCNGR